MARFSRSIFPFAVFLMASAAHGATVNVSASVWGVAQDAGRNGSFDSLSSTTNIFIQRVPNGDFFERALWEFDLSELPTGTILGIELTLVVNSTTLERDPYDVYGYAGNGIIEVADATAGSVLATGLNGDLSISTFDVTAFIFNASVQAAGFAGFIARYPNELAGGAQKNWLDPDDNFGIGSPWLVVEFTPVPIPASVWLFGSALGLLGWMRRRKAV